MCFMLPVYHRKYKKINNHRKPTQEEPCIYSRKGKISKVRLAKLEKVVAKELMGVVERIRKEKVAGYQERLIEEYEIDKDVLTTS